MPSHDDEEDEDDRNTGGWYQSSWQTEVTTTLTVEQRRDVRDVLRKPLRQRSVLIPFGTKAFLAGTLQPTMKKKKKKNDLTNNSETTKEEEEEEEHVQLVLTAQTKEEDLKTTKVLTTTRPQAQALLLESFKSTTTKHSDSSSTRTPSAAATSSNDNDQSLVFFDIQEEFDHQGNEIRAQAMNVSKQLDYLRTSLTFNNNNNTTATLSPDPQRTRDGRETTPRNDTVGTNEWEDTGTVINEPPSSSSSQRVPSDEEYQTLSARLDHLALLEEQEQQQQHQEQQQPKSVSKGTRSSTGWKSGFLNQKKQSKPKTEVAKPMTITEAKPNTNISSTSKSVAFVPTETTRVHEIPRVGTRSVKELQTNKPRSQPIDASVFSGIIHDRNSQSSVQVSDTNTTTSSSTSLRQEDSAGVPTTPSNKSSTKKLSRFAMERQQLRR